jgi:hypothetical protein
VAQLCVNTLLATKVILNTDGTSFGTLRVQSLQTTVLQYMTQCSLIKFTNGSQELAAYGYGGVSDITCATISADSVSAVFRGPKNILKIK